MLKAIIADAEHGPFKALFLFERKFSIRLQQRYKGRNGITIVLEITSPCSKEGKGIEQSSSCQKLHAHIVQISHRPNNPVLPQCQLAGLQEARGLNTRSRKPMHNNSQQPIDNKMLLAYRRKQEMAYVSDFGANAMNFTDAPSDS